MIDKDIKDYCKNCDVEPPAMRFKCPECEHNTDNENIFARDTNVSSKEQTNDSLKNQDKNFNENFTQEKEQIMIDGIDASKCKYLPYCNDKQGNCAFEPNCYFKQLARKTQVIDEIEEVIKPYQEQIELDALSLPSAIESILERKTQECEELKGKYKNILDLAKQNADANEYCLQELEQENYRYRKALEEVKEYTIKQFCDNCEDVVSTEYNCHCEYCEYQKYFDIIQKVKQVKN